MVRQVVGDQAEVLLDLVVFEQVTPLPPVGSRGVLQDERDALSRLFVVHAVLDTLDAHVPVAADRAVHLAVHVRRQLRRLASGRTSP